MSSYGVTCMYLLPVLKNTYYLQWNSMRNPRAQVRLPVNSRNFHFQRKHDVRIFDFIKQNLWTVRKIFFLPLHNVQVRNFRFKHFRAIRSRWLLALTYVNILCTSEGIMRCMYSVPVAEHLCSACFSFAAIYRRLLIGPSGTIHSSERWSRVRPWEPTLAMDCFILLCSLKQERRIRINSRITLFSLRYY